MEEISAPTNQENAKGEEKKGGEDKKKEKGKSQYLINRETNNENNRELLVPVFEALEGLEEGYQASKKKKKEGKKATKAKDKRSHK